MTEDEFLAAQERAAKALYWHYSPLAPSVQWRYLNQHTKDGWYERALIALDAAGLKPDGS